MAAGLDPALVEILRCPVTRQRLAPAIPEQLAKAAAGGPALEAGLSTGDGCILYPVRNGIPVLLPEEAIRLDQGPVA